MSRISLQKQLAYDQERRRWYVTLPGPGRRTATFPTLRGAMAALYPGTDPDASHSPAPPPPDGQATLGQWIDWWLREEVSAKLAASTAYGYRNIARLHVLPALGDVPLGELTAVQVQVYLYAKQSQGLSPNTVRKHYTLLYTVLKMAVKLGCLERNPLSGVIAPRPQETAHRFYSPEQLRILFRAADGTPLALAVRLAAYLGLRRSEIAGLKWQCVDLEAGIVVIQESRTEVGGREVVKPPKTRRSVRRLSIAGAPDLAAALERAHQRRRSDDPEEYVLLRPDGSPPTPNYLTEALARLVRRHHLPKITLHGLRHSFASIANSQQVSMHDISRALGHSSIAVTSGIYTHLFDETERVALSAVARAIDGR